MVTRNSKLKFAAVYSICPNLKGTQTVNNRGAVIYTSVFVRTPS